MTRLYRVKLRWPVVRAESAEQAVEEAVKALHERSKWFVTGVEDATLAKGSVLWRLLSGR